jgi:hypothetical protein
VDAGNPLQEGQMTVLDAQVSLEDGDTPQEPIAVPQRQQYLRPTG